MQAVPPSPRSQGGSPRSGVSSTSRSSSSPTDDNRGNGVEQAGHAGLDVPLLREAQAEQGQPTPITLRETLLTTLMTLHDEQNSKIRRAFTINSMRDNAAKTFHQALDGNMRDNAASLDMDRGTGEGSVNGQFTSDWSVTAVYDLFTNNADKRNTMLARQVEVLNAEKTKQAAKNDIHWYTTQSGRNAARIKAEAAEKQAALISHTQTKLYKLETALSDDNFKQGHIISINEAIATFSAFLYHPRKKTSVKISSATGALFQALLATIPDNEENKPQKQAILAALGEMISSSSRLSNREALLPNDRLKLIEAFTSSTELFINRLFASITIPKGFEEQFETFKDATYLCIANATTLMCYQQRSKMQKFQLFIKRSFLPLAYLCTKAEGIAAGYLTASIGAKIAFGTGFIATMSSPAILFVGSGLLGIAITYGLFRLGENQFKKLEVSLEKEIAEKVAKLKTGFGVKNEEKAAQKVAELIPDASAQDERLRRNKAEARNQALANVKPLKEQMLNAHIEMATGLPNGGKGASTTALSHNNLFNHSRSTLPATQHGDLPQLNAPSSSVILPGKASPKLAEEVKEKSEKLEKSVSQHYESQNPKPSWLKKIQAVKNVKNESLSKKQLFELKQTQLAKLFMVEGKGEEANKQNSLIGELFYLTHKFINNSDRASNADLIALVTQMHDISGKLSKMMIGNLDRGSPRIKADIPAYLQNYLYNAAIMLSMNHRDWKAKSNRFASIAIAPVCNTLLKVETMGVALLTQILIGEHIHLVAVQVLADSFFSIVGGIPFLVMSVALGAYSLKKADKSDESGIRLLNKNIKDLVCNYLGSKKAELTETLSFISAPNAQAAVKEVVDPAANAVVHVAEARTIIGTKQQIQEYLDELQSEEQNYRRHLLIKAEQTAIGQPTKIHYVFVNSLENRELGFVPYGAPVIAKAILERELGEIERLGKLDADLPKDQE